MNHVFRLLAFVCVCLFPVAAVAEEGGAVTIEIDGQTYQFPLWAQQSDWSGWGAPDNPSGSVNIYARPTDEATWALFKTLSLGFSFAGTVASNPEANLVRIVEGEQQRLFAGDDADEGGLSVSLTDIRVDGTELTVAGSFQGQMGTSPNYGRDVDLSSPVPLHGTFEVVLGPVE